jgi:hypothetical protein
MTREESKQLIEITKDSINKLVKLGADYKHFYGAKLTNKNLKKIKKLLEPIK